MRDRERRFSLRGSNNIHDPYSEMRGFRFMNYLFLVIF